MAYPLLRLSALECLNSFADSMTYYASADFCPVATSRSSQSLYSDAEQTSRGKFNRLQCTTAESTLRVLDEYGLCDVLPARPTLAPLIRFLFIGPHL